MAWLFAIVGLAALSPFLVRAFASADPKRVARVVRAASGVAAILVGLAASARGAFVLGVPVALFGAGLLFPRVAPRRSAGSGAGEERAPPARPMTVEEALEVLGLEPGATPAEIRDAYKALMQRVHPDHGGSDWMAAKLNAARDTLLGRGR